jgi:hypothetical protein
MNFITNEAHEEHEILLYRLIFVIFAFFVTSRFVRRNDVALLKHHLRQALP